MTARATVMVLVIMVVVIPALYLLTRTLEQEQAVEAIDCNTIGLLVGMMLMCCAPATACASAWPRNDPLARCAR